MRKLSCKEVVSLGIVGACCGCRPVSELTTMGHFNFVQFTVCHLYLSCFIKELALGQKTKCKHCFYLQMWFADAIWLVSPKGSSHGPEDFLGHVLAHCWGSCWNKHYYDVQDWFTSQVELETFSLPADLATKPPGPIYLNLLPFSVPGMLPPGLLGSGQCCDSPAASRPEGVLATLFPSCLSSSRSLGTHLG